MYNGIGLTTPRGSGTNGHVQRNWAFVRPGKKDNVTYKIEEDLAKLDATSNRQPNQGILDHERKRQLEVKCAEYEEILENQKLNKDEILAKVNTYRLKLLGHGKADIPKDEFGRIIVRETHQIAEAQQEKNAKLREAFGISEYFVEGSSFDPDRKAKEDLAKSTALRNELQMQKDAEKEKSKKYTLVRTPSKDRDDDNNEDGGVTKEKKKKKKQRSGSASPVAKKAKKKKKSKKNKKEKSKKKRSKDRHYKNIDTDADYSDDSSDSDADTSANKKKSKKDKKKSEKKKRKHDSDDSRESSTDRKRKKTANQTVSISLKDKNYSRGISRDRRPNENSDNRSSRKSRSRSQKRRARSPIDPRSISPKRSKLSDDYCHRDRDRSYTPKKNDRNRSTKVRRSSPSTKQRDDRRRSTSIPIKRYRNRSSSLELASSTSKRDDRKRSQSPLTKSRRNQPSPTPKRNNHHDDIRSAKYQQQQKYSSSFDQSRGRSRLKNNDHKKSTNRNRSASRQKSSKNKPNQRDDRSKSQSRNRRSKSKNHNGNHQSPPPPVRQKRSTSRNVRDDIDRRYPHGSRNKSVSPPQQSHASSNSQTTNTNSVTKKLTSTKTGNERSRSQSRSRSKSQRHRISTRRHTPPMIKSPQRDRSYQNSDKYDKSLKPNRASRREEFLKSPKTKSSSSSSLANSVSVQTPASNNIPASQKSTKNHSHSSDSSLSYSPARQNPDRYKDILDRKETNSKGYHCRYNQSSSVSPQRSSPPSQSQTSKDKSHTPSETINNNPKSSSSRSQKKLSTLQQPVVRLHTSTDSEHEDMVDTSKLDKYEEIIRKDDEILKALSGIAAKAKEKIKTMSEPATNIVASNSSSSSAEVIHNRSPDAFLSREMAIASVSMASNALGSTGSNFNLLHDSDSKGKQLENALKINEFIIKGRKDITEQCNQMDQQQQRTYVRSRSKSISNDVKDVNKIKTKNDYHSRSKSRHSSSSSSASSRRSSSRSSDSRSVSSKSSRSASSSSTSSRTTRSSRSPSIPRRRGSPSFLDRRRITSARKRPIPYHRPTPSSPSSVSSFHSRRSTPPQSPFKSNSRSISRTSN